MATLRSVVNHFLGINPLLMSHLQEDGWDNFHLNHISDLTRELQRTLRFRGYLAQIEQSIQIRWLSNLNYKFDLSVEPDVQQPNSMQMASLSGSFVKSIPDLLELDEATLSGYRAVVICQQLEDGTRGNAVAWLELLSPITKKGGSYTEAYRNKRAVLLQAGLVFIELDYLHQQFPTVATPIYPHQSGSSPYRIVIIDPRPNWLRGKGWIYPIAVDEKLPRLELPLNAGDMLQFNFDVPYQKTYENLFLGDLVNYAVLPVAWETYSLGDQTQILSRLLAIRENSTELEKPLDGIAVLPFNEALKRWQATSEE